ncbi:hypothetical protein PVAND_014256 [Polypedilum vanderplanki]|uniref:Uncharacterized protein n=1 Tax=Polypedilum vanderplanki TaxID=319348 RepID=A0A9J6CTE7_POLVA|nr:hypothetical protein PVAND_014256 [Polypedilum vanderplanki]
MDRDKTVCNNNNTLYEKPTNLESNLIKSECLKRTLDGLASHNHLTSSSESKEEPKSVHEEKTDVSPEISNKKSNDTSPMTDSNCSGSNCFSNRMNKSFSMNAFGNEEKEDKDDRAEVSKSMAFTIDFDSGKQVDEQRHKNLLERFQSRHRRGVSLSKVEDEMCDSNSSSQLAAKLKSPASAKFQRRNSRDVIESPQKTASASSSGVRLREKTKTTQLRDASKRHSWSPRSSMVEPTNHQKETKMTSTRNLNGNPLERPLKMHVLTKADMKPLPPTTLNITCLQPPLENKESHRNDDDQVSEAGTYTLDDANYTEEQKEKMNIDKLNNDHEAELLQRKLEINESDSNIETDLEVIDLEQDSNVIIIPPVRHAAKVNRKNILEVSFYHQEPTASSSAPVNGGKSKVSYLEKLKSRVKNIGDKKFHKTKSSSDDDMGTFTSVTTSGILSIKPTLDTNPKLKRKNSLTKSQIDSSEYVQGLQTRTAVDKAPITDNDKSIAAGYQQISPSKSRKESVGSSSTSISTAATKDDWIQEWAKNAREYSRHKRNPNTAAMSNSYNFESSLEKGDQFGYFSDDVMSRSDCKPQYEEFGDNLEKYHQKNHHHKKPPTSETVEDRTINNLSDHEPISISSARSRRILRDFDLNKQEPPRTSNAFNIKPPISPCRIPSPMGSYSNRQKRYGSNKMLYGSETDLTNDTELYLQRTAAAISTLQNLQRKNSLRNSSLQNSPVSPLSPQRPPMPQQPNIKTVYLPPPLQHARAQSVTRNTVHKRNSSLDSSRYTPMLSTSLQANQLNNYLINDNLKSQKHTPKQQQQQQHSRHNSYDGILPSSQHRVNNNLKYSQFDQTDDDYESMSSRGAMLSERQHVSIKQQHQDNIGKQQQHQASPIKRSSSFSTKAHEISARGVSSGTPKMQNKFIVKTSSAPTSSHGMRIQKSASSSCFKQITNALDDADDYENEFYINDDDNLNPNQFTPSDESEEEQKYSLTSSNDKPMTNTRINKTFLMRCEQSKNKVGGKQLIGVIACPNTPELPRRDVAARASMRDRASMPRDSSLGRVLDKKPLSAGSSINKSNINNNINSSRVTSKYLDISKYKPEKGNNFLKRDESKSYLNREVKKSSSSACLQNFQRDLTRASNRSTGGSGGSNSRPSSATASKKKDVKNAKEIELAMWKRRASYDPMKAAAEGKRKAEEAKRLAQQQQMILSSEGSSSAMRSSKSYHSGAANEWIDDDSEDDSEFDDEN